MTEQDIINQNLQRQIDAQNSRIDNVMTKVDIFIAECQQQREDMRRLWERQDAAQAKHDADMKAAQEKHDADMKAAQEKHDADMKEMNQRFYAKFDAMDKKIDDKFDKFSSQLQMMSVTTILGVGAIVWAIVSALK
ncbi:MAG: hypothetical protein IKN27_12150 [Selenomonadaceae bacterium]|nr:hypothetical protein [Selenomonadaceae bacterium]